MDNLKSCFFCLKYLPDGGNQTPNKTKVVCRFFEMVHRYIGGSSVFPFKQPQVTNLVTQLFIEGDIWPCSQCLSVLETFNELYHQLKIIELKTNMVLAKIGDIMGHSSKSSVKTKRRFDDLRKCSNQWKTNCGNKKLKTDKLNRVRQKLKLKCRSYLARQLPLVAVKRCKLEASRKITKRFNTDVTIKKEYSDDMECNQYQMTQQEHGIMTLLLVMTSLKIVLHLSLVNTAGFWSPVDLQNYQEQLNFQRNGVRNILLAMASVKTLFVLASINSNNAWTLHQLKEAKDIPIDDDKNDQWRCDGITGSCPDEKVCHTNNSAGVSPHVLKSLKDVLKRRQCPQTLDYFSSLKDHWAHVHRGSKKNKSSSFPTNVDFAKRKNKFLSKDKVVKEKLIHANNANSAQKLPTEACEIPIDDSDIQNHQLTSVNTCEEVTCSGLKECDTLCKTVNDSQTTNVLKPSKDVFNCHRCEKPFDNFSSLKYHWLRCDLKQDKPSSSRTTADKLVMLARSRRKFVAKDEVVQAKTQENAHGRKKFECEKCPKISYSKQLFINHQFTHSDQSTWPYACSICGKRFIVNIRMQFHTLKTHPNDPITQSIRLQLQLGNKRRQRRLSQPRRQPKDKKTKVKKPRSYKCSECGKDCRNNQHYQYHLKTHSSPDNWKHFCSVCGRRFICKSSLDSHFRTHTKEKPFSCSKCGQHFAYRASRENHMLVWHGP